MRRIIERVVTVVTTTTWTISWKDDPLPSEGKVDPAAPADSTPDAASNLPSVIEAKEVQMSKESKK
jgi:hypothetical protein